jgi:hypothetical protein
VLRTIIAAKSPTFKQAEDSIVKRYGEWEGGGFVTTESWIWKLDKASSDDLYYLLKFLKIDCESVWSK